MVSLVLYDILFLLFLHSSPILHSPHIDYSLTHFFLSLSIVSIVRLDNFKMTKDKLNVKIVVKIDTVLN